MKLKRARTILLLISTAAILLILISPKLHFVVTLHSQLNKTRIGTQWTTGSTEGHTQKSQARMRDLSQSCSSLQGSQADVEAVDHIFFLKVHKAGSTSLSNLLYRYALTRNLSVALGRKGLHIAQGTGKWEDQVQPLRPGSGAHYDILATHVIFNDTAVRQWLPADTKYVAIVRHPYAQFVSAFYYYRDAFHYKQLMQVPGKDPIQTILSDPDKWDAKLRGCNTMVYNRMLCDFGVLFDQMGNRTFLENYISYIDSKFHLVMISEYFTESLVLLKRLLSWSLTDILYVYHSNLGNYRQYDPTPRETADFRKTRLADFMLYDRFLAVFRAKVTAGGEEFFEEVKTFDRVRRKVEKFCRGRTKVSNETLTVEATKYNSCFFVNGRDCDFLSLDFVPLTSRVRASMRERGIVSEG